MDQSFDDYFTDDAIIAELCKIRVKMAKQRNDMLFWNRISSEKGRFKATAASLFPPRRLWKRFRPRVRRSRGSFKINLKALIHAVFRLRQESPKPEWAVELERKVEAIRSRALSADPFRFAEPRIYGVEKDPRNHEYRPIAEYEADDKVIDCLTARYFRCLLDCALSDSCLAFRIRKGTKPPPQTHDALKKILNLRRRHSRAGVYVAECDIKGFYDTVSHKTARVALLELIADAAAKTKQMTIDPRAIAIFDAYLASYAFPRSVNEVALKRLKERDAIGTFKWPEVDLKDLYGGVVPAEIGVPQGGALSCLIANVVLHYADKKMEKGRRRVEKPYTYLRYCDDMILLSSSKSSCSKAYDIYQTALGELKLPCHRPKQVEPYSGEGKRSFWEGKSNSPYLWSRPRRKGAIPWIQFVGYQMRHDGMVRVRIKSLKKHRQKVTDVADRLLATLNPGRSKPGERTPFASGLRKRKAQIIHRLRQKLISMSVGRRQLGIAIESPMPMCWAAGFRGLTKHPYPKNSLRALDRHRERQIQRVVRRLCELPDDEVRSDGGKRAKALPYYGFNFSYAGQFEPSLRRAQKTWRKMSSAN